ncbi:MAG: EF-P lysine aminoacylase EpmA [Cardiobacteriaceae bacterium]|nr:EF-P lysine aminoacylase EpmA [Cardiobacteriaceae bacterium]
MRKRIGERAAFLAAIRAFFAARDVLEVDTAHLRAFGVTDPHLVCLPVPAQGFLQTSPEYAMKRLLAAGSGDIYQLAHVFRGEEQGRKHQREFMMLEWYRAGFDHRRLMQEVAELVHTLLPRTRELPVRHTPYRTAFSRRFGRDIMALDDDALRRFCAQQLPESAEWALDRDGMLDLLFTHFIEAQLGADSLEFILDYPPSQAALARLHQDAHGNAVAARFELYYRGMELCNGFWELADADQQRERFLADNRQREQMALPAMAIDEGFLDALAQGLPDCAGVALGVDRLLMLHLDAAHIGDVTLADW